MGAILISDFDGTAVEKLKPKLWQPRTRARNMFKYPLAGMDGYIDFLEGVNSTGVENGGVATIRKEWARRWVTERSIRKLGMTGFFGDPESVFYGGNEGAKALRVADVALDETKPQTVGMIEDMPQKFVPELVERLDFAAHMAGVPEDCPVPRVIVGAVQHPDRPSRLNQMMRDIFALSGDPWGWTEQSPQPREQADGSIRIRTDFMNVSVVRLGAYSYDEGVRFGERLLADS